MNKLLLACSFFISQLLMSQVLITDLGIYPPPSPPALPSAGGVITDATFGTEILRVTDESDGPDNMHGYSYWPCFNMDNSMIYVYRVNGTAKVYDLDTNTFTISNKREAFTTLVDGEYPMGEDQIWSRTDKNILYCHTQKKIAAYNITDQDYVIVKDFNGVLPDNNILSQISCSEDASKFAFSKKKLPGYQTIGYCVWDSATDSLYDFDNPDVDEVQLDRTGNFLWIKTGLQGAGVIQAYVLDLNTGISTGLTDNEPDYAPGHGDVGHEFIIGVENWNNRILRRQCDDPHTFTEIWNYEGDWNQDTHISMLAANEDWVLVSCYLAGPTFPFTGLFENEIFQIATDGSKKVQRLAHHQSDYLLSGSNYWASPRANISYTGDYIMFTSNWGVANRTDVFIVKIPKVEDTTEVSINNIFPEVKIYPNPVTDILHVELTSEANNAYLFIYDITGKLCFSKQLNDKISAVDIDHLHPGIYTAEMMFGADRSKMSFVKR